MTDPFTAASPTYIAAQRTNQGRGRGYGFFMDEVVNQSPLWIRAIEILCRPSSVFSLSLLGLCVWLLVKF